MAITNTNSSRGIDNNTNAEELVVFQANADELGISGGGGGGGVWTETTVTLTSAQVLSLAGGGSIELLAAPEAGKYRALRWAFFKPVNGTSYTSSSTAYLADSSSIGTAVYADSVQPNAFTTSSIYVKSGAMNVFPQTPIYLISAGTYSISGGTADVEVTIVYRDI